MTRILLAVVLFEIVIGSVLVHQYRNSQAAPLPNLALFDAVTAEEFRNLARSAQTASDWAKLAEVYLATGCYPESEACWKRATELEPATSDYHFKHAFTLERLGLIAEANSAYETAIGKKFSRASDAWYYIGRNHLRLENASAARDAFTKAGALPGARWELALLDAREGRREDAETVAEKLAMEFPQSYPPIALQIRLAIDAKNFQAIGELSDRFSRRARPLPTPFDTEVDWVLGRANGVGHDRLFRDAGRDMQAGKIDGVETKLREALQSRWDPEVADKMAEVAFVRNRREDALKILNEVIERGGPTAFGLWRRGQAELALAQTENALATWERAANLASGPNGRDLFQDLAMLYERMGKPAQAQSARARCALAAGIWLLETGRLGEAREQFLKATQEDPKSAAAWYELAETERRAGQVADSRTAYERCLKLDPNFGRAKRAQALLP